MNERFQLIDVDYVEFLCLHLFITLLLVWESWMRTEAVEFNMLFMTKCIAEEIPPNSQVELEYVAYDKFDGNRNVGMKITVEDPEGKQIHEATKDMANVTFRATVEGEYKACFNVPSSSIASRVKLSLDWRLGSMGIDWDVIARKEHLDEIDAYMERFQRTIRALNEELKEIRIKEVEMRRITEATNTRVALLSIFCVGVCIMITGFQVWYLRRFFTKKKII